MSGMINFLKIYIMLNFVVVHLYSALKVVLTQIQPYASRNLHLENEHLSSLYLVIVSFPKKIHII